MLVVSYGGRQLHHSAAFRPNFAPRSLQAHAVDECVFSARSCRKSGVMTLPIKRFGLLRRKVRSTLVATRPGSAHILGRMPYNFYTADVFTDHLHGGNPLAVLP